MTPNRGPTPKKPNYQNVVSAVLAPQGFVRGGMFWRRESGRYGDTIHLQHSSFDRTLAINVGCMDRDADHIVEAAGANIPVRTQITVRLGHLFDKYDHWWPNDDPGGPADVADKIERFALPFLDGLHSREAMIAYLAPRAIKWRNPPAQMALAVMLQRVGRLDDALATLADPPKRVGAERPERLAEYLANLPMVATTA